MRYRRDIRIRICLHRKKPNRGKVRNQPFLKVKYLVANLESVMQIQTNTKNKIKSCLVSARFARAIL